MVRATLHHTHRDDETEADTVNWNYISDLIHFLSILHVFKVILICFVLLSPVIK